jgi:hypothetical protein
VADTLRIIARGEGGGGGGGGAASLVLWNTVHVLAFKYSREIYGASIAHSSRQAPSRLRWWVRFSQCGQISVPRTENFDMHGGKSRLVPITTSPSN